MCAYVCQQYKVRPTEIYGHRDFKDTACPGDALYRMLPKLRTEVAALLREDTGSSAASTEAWPLLRVADRGADVQAAQHLLRAAGQTRGACRTAGSTGAPPTPCAGSSRCTAPRRSTG